MHQRLMQLPDLFQLKLEREGPTDYNSLVVVMDQGKTNQYGRIEYGAAI
jgi:hypothetical protein